MNEESRKHWELQGRIANVEIRALPSWDITIVVASEAWKNEKPFFELRNTIQDELDKLYNVFSKEGIFFKKIDLKFNGVRIEGSIKTKKNPFILLDSFREKDAEIFAGREREIQEMIEKVLRRKLVVVIGESGVGKTSLVNAGVLPKLKRYDMGIVRFSLQDNIEESILDGLGGFGVKTRKKCNDKYDINKNIDIVQKLSNAIKRKRGKIKSLLLIGDHLEQIFVMDKSKDEKIYFARLIEKILRSDLNAKLLFCIREDYLPDLYTISEMVGEFYETENTIRIHRLDRQSGKDVLRRASESSKRGISRAVINQMIDDLCIAGDGLIYPPFLQIVGHRLYATQSSSYQEIDIDTYKRLGGAESIVNRYLETLLDEFNDDDRRIVIQILGMMVTEHYTKKRVRQSDLADQVNAVDQNRIPRLINKLVQKRIIKRSLNEYELVHDFLARKVIKFLNEEKYMPPPIRRALKFIDENFANSDLRMNEIVKMSGLSENRLRMMFNQELECSIKHRLDWKRIEAAKKMIVQEGGKFNDIAKKVGFKSQESFNRRFKALEGLKPMEYKKTVFIRNHPRSGQM
jgi:AraC-like DNA-binding protein